MALAPYALSTPDLVRAAQGWSVSSHPDARLIPKINGLSKVFTEITGRQFGFKRFASDSPLFVAGNGSSELWLPFSKIRELVSVSIVGQSLTLRQASLDGFAAYPDGAFQSPQWDEEGRLLRPCGWPRGGQGTWCDGTRHLRLGAPTAWTVSLVGDFGFILPQYDGETDPDHNPDGGEADLPEDLLQAFGWALDQEFSQKSGNLLREKTAGGRELEYAQLATTQALQRRAELTERLGSYVMPQAYWAG